MNCTLAAIVVCAVVRIRRLYERATVGRRVCIADPR